MEKKQNLGQICIDWIGLKRGGVIGYFDLIFGKELGF